MVLLLSKTQKSSKPFFWETWVLEANVFDFTLPISQRKGFQSRVGHQATATQGEECVHPITQIRHKGKCKYEVKI